VRVAETWKRARSRCRKKQDLRTPSTLKLTPPPPNAPPSTAPVVEEPVALVAVDPAPTTGDADATPAAGAVGDKKAKKKRDNNPGVRVQGGRIYDSEKGTTCHQV